MLMCLDSIFDQKAGTYIEGFDDYKGQLWLTFNTVFEEFWIWVNTVATLSAVQV